MPKNLSFVVFIIILLLSCNRSENIQSIGETEYYFNEKLSSVTFADDGSLWIGTETGDAINVKDNTRIPFDLREDRIYKIATIEDANEDTLLWVAVRNSGLQQWRKDKTGKYEKLKTYDIDFKKNRYSPYDFIKTDNAIYVATSQGFYYFNPNDQDSIRLSLIYPSVDFLSEKDGTPFLIHNLALYKDSLILGATQSGLLCYNLTSKKINLSESKKHIEHVSIYNDTIFILSGDSLLIFNPAIERIGSIKLAYSPKLYYQAQGIHYFICSEEILLSDDLLNFYPYHLRRAIPTNSRNLIVADSSAVFTYLVTEKALWRISNNINIFRSNKSIKASCSNSNSIYYLSNHNELYKQNIGDTNARWIYTFPQNNQIQWIDIVDDDLYLYNLNNEYQKMSLSNSWLKNTFLGSPKTIFKSDAKITAARLKSRNDKQVAYLGIQDGAIVVDDHGRVDSITALSNEYLTSMFGHKGSERLYISTLNNGVYYLSSNDEVLVVPHTRNLAFITDIIATDHHQANLILLTNKEIISQESTDTIQAKGYKKLLYANDTLFYALPEFGIQKFEIQGNRIIDREILYKDISFDKNSSFSVGNKLVLVSNVGALNLSINAEDEPLWVSFEDAKNINPLEFVLSVLLIILLIFIVFIIIRKKRQARIAKVLNSKEDLSKRLKDITLYYHVLDDSDNQEIALLKSKTDSISPKSQNLNELKTELDNTSLQIGKLNRKIALRIHNRLEEQINELKQIQAYDKDALLKKSYQISKEEDIEAIKDRIHENDLWLHKREQLLASIGVNKERLTGCIEIEGINKNLYHNILKLEEDILHKPLDKIIGWYQDIEIQIENINSMSTLGIIKQYIEDVSLYFDKKIESDSHLAFLNDELKIIKKDASHQDNLTLLKNLADLNQNYRLFKILDEIKINAKRYKDVHDQVVEENDQQVNKKFERELALLISDRTRNITETINELISDLYQLLLNTEPYVIKDILKLSNIEGQHAKVLALLIANFKIKRTLIPGILGVYGNLNPVVSRLINDRIRAHEPELKQIQKHREKKSLLIYLILKFVE